MLKWLDTIFTDEFEEILYWGTPEDGLYEEVDGERRFKDERMQDYYVNKNMNALDASENKLCGSYLTESVGIRRYARSKFDPTVMKKNKVYKLNEKSAVKFPIDSQHTQNIVKLPPCKMTSPEFASLPDVREFWSTRSQWDDPFKLTLAANSDEEFNKKWQECVDNIYKTADVNAMLDAMTEIARKYVGK